MFKVSRVFGAFCLLIVSFGWGGCSRPQEPSWNVAEVVGHPIDVAKQKLGTPQKEELPPPGTSPVIPSPTAQSTWQSGGNTLAATWKTANKRVTSWTISRPDPNDAVREENKDALLKPNGLKEGDPHYSVEWLEAPEKPLFYSGARIIPTPKMHTAILRVTGGTAFLNVTYAVSGPQPQGETVMTIAPWEMTFNVPDDTQLSIKSSILKIGKARVSAEMKVEILVDGKVVASDASPGTGRTVQCQFEL